MALSLAIVVCVVELVACTSGQCRRRRQRDRYYVGLHWRRRRLTFNLAEGEMDLDIRLDTRLLPERHGRLILDLHVGLPACLHHLYRELRIEEEREAV
jgi:hypothetical protein